MASGIRFDVSDVVDDGNFYAGPDPVRGTYPAKVANIELGKNKAGDKDMLTVRYEITSGKYKGWAGWDRITLEQSTKFKLRQLIDAAGLPAKGTVDKILKDANGKPVGILVKMGSDQNGSIRAEIGRPFEIGKLGAGAEEDDEETTEDEADEAVDANEPDEDEDAEDEADEDESDEDEEDEEDEAWTEDELSELSDSDLADVAGEFEVEAKVGTKGKSKGKLTDRAGVISAILEAQDEGDEEGEDEEGDEADDESPSEEELNGMGLVQLKALAEEQGVTLKRGAKKPSIVAALLAHYGDGDSTPPF